MQRIVVDVQNQVYEHVMFFLSHLPGSRIHTIESPENARNTTPDSNRPDRSVFAPFLSRQQTTDTFVAFDREALHER